MNNIAQQHKKHSGPEEITLYSSMPEELQEEQQDAESLVATLKFTQLDKRRSIGKKLVLYDNKQLSISDYALKSKREYWLNIRYMHPKALAKWHIAWKWLGATLVSSALASVAAAVAAKPIFNIDRWTAAGVSVLFIGLTVLSAFTLYRNSRHVLNFFSLNGRIPVLQLIYNNPDREQFNKLINNLQERIKASQQKQHMAKNEALAAELSMHRQLMQNKIIGESAYNMAKSRLFSMHSG